MKKLALFRNRPIKSIQRILRCVYQIRLLMFHLSIPKLVKWLQKVKMFHKIFSNYQCLLDLL